MLTGKYELKTLLGEGGMGQVWQAVDLSLKREVAIKVLPEATASDPEFRERFRREARLAARLNHQHIATVFAVEEQESTLYLVMELVKGLPLDRMIADGPLPTAKAVEIMLQVTSAIGEAHMHGIIHRDIKPENIMVAPRGVKVLDFGIAREIAPPENGNMTRTGVIMGTPQYMSPEQAQGLPLTAQSDIFSLGAVLYEMLSGQTAFAGATALQTLLNVVAAKYPPLTGVPRSLAAIVDRCLAKKPEDRFRSAGELEEALANWTPDYHGEKTLFLEPNRPRALVADDDAVSRCFLRATLEGMGYGVDEAADGSEAISHLKKDHYALLITDLLMPRLDGWNVIDFIRASAARRPDHVLVSTVMNNVTLGKVEREIVEAVIPKPVTAARLREVLAPAH